jgi:hypothetical protein
MFTSQLFFFGWGRALWTRQTMEEKEVMIAQQWWWGEQNCSIHKKARRSRTVPWLSRDSTASLNQGSNSDLSSEDDEIEEPNDNNYEEYTFVGV